MTPPVTAQPAAASPVPLRRERRGGERVKVRGLWCDRGQVLDFSARGMRLTTLRRWPEGSVRRITLHIGDKTHVVEARCVWCRQDAMFTHAVGVAFENVGPETARALDAIAAEGTE